ncbi:hypothetical protein ACFL7E_02535 [Thermodesulfobacteriota bacterium]
MTVINFSTIKNRLKRIEKRIEENQPQGVIHEWALRYTRKSLRKQDGVFERAIRKIGFEGSYDSIFPEGAAERLAERFSMEYLSLEECTFGEKRMCQERLERDKPAIEALERAIAEEERRRAAINGR